MLKWSKLSECTEYAKSSIIRVRIDYFSLFSNRWKWTGGQLISWWLSAQRWQHIKWLCPFNLTLRNSAYWNENLIWAGAKKLSEIHVGWYFFSFLFSISPCVPLWLFSLSSCCILMFAYNTMCSYASSHVTAHAYRKKLWSKVIVLISYSCHFQCFSS